MTWVYQTTRLSKCVRSFCVGTYLCTPSEGPDKMFQLYWDQNFSLLCVPLVQIRRKLLLYVFKNRLIHYLEIETITTQGYLVPTGSRTPLGLREGGVWEVYVRVQDGEETGSERGVNVGGP